MSWDVVYHAPGGEPAPAISFLDACPTRVKATMHAVLAAVAASPPPRFSGCGMWEAMHGGMGGYYEVRVTGPGREQFRLFCILENADAATLAQRGLPRPAIAGMRKPWRTAFTEADYKRVREMGAAYLTSYPRPIMK